MMRDAWDRLPPLVRALLPGLVVTAVAAAGFFAILDEVQEQDSFAEIDDPVTQWFYDHRLPWLTTVMTWITTLFGPVVLPIIVGVGCAVWWWRTRQWRDPALLAGAMILSTIMTMTIKVIVERPRPEELFQVVPGYETSFSFPSGHSTGAATFVMVIAYLLWRRHRTLLALVLWSLGAIAITAIVATTRMYLGYHFLSDVLAGACVGLFTLGLVICVDRWLDLRMGTRAGVPIDQASAGP
ncbi:phosphatase PAP2 family protein [Demequina sp. NBRC 110053]|uniref:phosphatase PAP2 family protein n=1 Tax=Demequina sp. NBRC 110053 TaxID=1570342 RepID=UPI000A004B8C|nr:phosphatase PAP2 family protein [Demequina sp. NBRC 110053]